MDSAVVCCECGEAVRGIVCHDADGCHALHFGCKDKLRLQLSHCHCAGYPLAGPLPTPPQQPLAPTPALWRMPFSDITSLPTPSRTRAPFTNLANVATPLRARVPFANLENVPRRVAPRRSSRTSLGDIDMDGTSYDTSPSSIRTSPDTSPTNYDTSPSNDSIASFGDCSSSSMDCDDQPESMRSLAVKVMAISGQQLCELWISPSTCVIGLKIMLERKLQVPVRKQDLLWGVQLLCDRQSFHSILQEEPVAVSNVTITFVSQTTSPGPHYLQSQDDVNKRLRYTLVDWLISEHASSQDVRQRSLFLAVRFVDLYLSQKQLQKKDLKLLGIAALSLAFKCDAGGLQGAPPAWNASFHELPYDSNLGRLTDNGYTVEEFVTMEHEMVDVLDLRNGAAQQRSMVVDYLMPFQSLDVFDQQHLKLIAYLAEHSLMSIRMLQHDPSRIAAAAVLLSNRIKRWHHAWPAAVSKELPYQEHEVEQCAKDLGRIIHCLTSRSSEFKALQKKFSEFQPTTPSANAARGGA